MWRAGVEARFPHINYVVFPGNVGDDQALARVAVKLGARRRVVPSDQVPVGFSTSDVRAVSLLDNIKTARKEKRAVAAFNICKYFVVVS